MTFDVEFDEVGAPMALDQVIEGRDLDGHRLTPAHVIEAAVAILHLGDPLRVDCRHAGVFWTDRELGAPAPAAQGHRFDRHACVPAVEAPEPLQRPFLRFHSNHACPEVTKGSRAVAQVGPDVEDQPATRHQRAVQRLQASQTPGPTVDPEGLQQAPLAREPNASYRTAPLHRVCGIVGIRSVCPKTVRPKSPTKHRRDPTARGSDRGRWISGLLALTAINGLLVLPLWWRDSAVTAWIPELGLIPLLLGLAALRPFRWFLAAALTFSFLALSGDALVRAVLDRPLNLALDPLLLRAGFHFLSGSLGLPVALLIALLVAALTGLLLWASTRLLDATARLPRVSAAVPLALICTPLIPIALHLASPAALQPALIELAIDQTRRIEDTIAAQSRLAIRAESPELQAHALPALAGREVSVIFIESYGMTAWTRTAYRETIAPLALTASQGLASAGLQTMSTRLRSPIRGGQSWLAHATLLSGQRIDNDLSFKRILASPQGFLSGDFAATGHATRVIAPAIVRPWPEAKEMGFEEIYPAAALDYQGPSAGWVGIPDQFTLHRFARIRAMDEQPAFNLLLLISSHAPWLAGPPLLKDWQRLDQARPWPDWTPPERDQLVYLRDVDRLRNRYPNSLAYSLEAVFTWAEANLAAEDILLVVGDHQPARLITGENSSPDVPVHLISVDAERVTERGDDLGFRPGLTPPAGQSESGLEDLRHWFRNAGGAMQ